MSCYYVSCQAMEPEKLEKIMKSILDPVASAEITLADKKAQDDFFQGITDMIEKELVCILCSKGVR